MKNYRKHIDDFFREKLGNYTETPPADVWDSLDVRLDSLKPVIPGSSARWLWHMGMVSLIVVLSASIGRRYLSSDAPGRQLAATQPADLPNSNTGTATQATAAIADAAPIAAASATTVQPATANNAATPAIAAGNSAEAQQGRKQVAVAAGHTSRINANGNAVLRTTAGSKKAAKVHHSDAPYSTAAGDIADENVSAANAGPTVTTPANSTVITATQPAPAKNQQALAAAFKKTGANSIKKDNRSSAQDIKRWEAGIKAGYERGFDNTGANKLAIAPYLQYNLSRKFALMVQPAVKIADAGNHNIGSGQYYYRANSDGTATQTASDVIVKVEGSVINTYYHTTYHYAQTHDSIVKSNTYGGRYMEYEFPVLLKYNLTAKASVYGGINIIYSQVSGVKENTYTRSGILKTADTTLVTATAPTAPVVSDVVSYSGKPYENYTGPLYPATQQSQLRCGAMLGFTYEYSRRWLIDALIQQNPAQAAIRGGSNINAPLSVTYFRLSVGYKLTK